MEPRLLLLALLTVCCFRTTTVLAAENRPQGLPRMEAIMDYLAQSPEFPGPPPDGRYTLRLVGWDPAKWDFIIKHYLLPTPDELAKRVQVAAADYLVSPPTSAVTQK